MLLALKLTQVIYHDCMILPQRPGRRFQTVQNLCGKAGLLTIRKAPLRQG